MPDDKLGTEELTPARTGNGHHGPSSDAIRLANIAMVIAALSEEFSQLSRDIGNLTKDEITILRIALSKSARETARNLEDLATDLEHNTD